MKLQSLIFVFLYCVYFVLSETSFIPKGQRAEIFELTDNEIPVFRITLSDEEFKLLKNKASTLNTNNVTAILLVNAIIKGVIDIINEQNLNELFPGYNFKEILPELPMNENGHPNIDYKEYYIDVSFAYYTDFINLKKTFQKIFSENSYLDLMNVLRTLSKLDVSSEINYPFMYLINQFLIEDPTIYDTTEIIGPLPEFPQQDDYFGYFYNYDGNNDLPSINLNYDLPSADWYSDSPSADWYSDSPSTDWNYEPPSTDWNYDSPNNDKNYYDSASGFLTFLEQYVYGSMIYEDKEMIYEDEDITDGDFDEVEEYTTITNDYINFDEFTSQDFYNYFKNYDFNKEPISKEEGVNDFKTKNATLIVEINNEKKIFDKITFSLEVISLVITLNLTII